MPSARLETEKVPLAQAWKEPVDDADTRRHWAVSPAPCVKDQVAGFALPGDVGAVTVGWVGAVRSRTWVVLAEVALPAASVAVTVSV